MKYTKTFTLTKFKQWGAMGGNATKKKYPKKMAKIWGAMGGRPHKSDIGLDKKR